MLNLSIYAIPLYWVMSNAPHAYGIGVIKKANNNRWDNLNSRSAGTKDKYKQAVPANTFMKFERAEAVHQNLLENAPLFFSAIVLGNVARLPANTLNLYTGMYLALRAVYIPLYIGTKTQKYSYLRTLNWVASVVVACTLIVKAGNKLANQA